MEKYNVLIGRFQPLTTSHIKCAKTALEMTGNKTKLLMIYRNKDKMSDKNPFDCEWLRDRYLEMLKDEDWFGGIVFVPNADLVKISQEVCFNISGWVCGTDRYQAYSEFVHKYKPQMKVTHDFSLIVVPRPDDDISATKARAALQDNDYNNWCQYSPFTSEEDFKLFQEHKEY